MHNPSPDIVRIKHMLDIAKEIIDFSNNKSREDLDVDVIWSTVTEDIPPLEGKIKIIVEEFDNNK